LVLAKRIIPCLDVKGGKVVKGRMFRNLRLAGDPAELGRRYSDEGADELVFLDITASRERRKILSKMVRRVASKLNIPFTVGGGIRGISDARLVLCNGADKVSVNTAAVERPELISELAESFGRQCVVVAIDAKLKMAHGHGRDYLYEVYTYGGTKPTGIDAIKWAKRAGELGAGELLVTSMDRDGTKLGFDLHLMRKLSRAVSIPLIASGGCGRLQHFFEVLTEGEADAALAASVFHYSEFSILQVKEFLKERGVLVRL
jgi:cyclase